MFIIIVNTKTCKLQFFKISLFRVRKIINFSVEVVVGANDTLNGLKIDNRLRYFDQNN